MTVATRRARPQLAAVREVFDRLLAAYGPQHWWPGDGPLEVIIGAILTQQTAWANVEKSLAAMRAAGALSPEGLCAIDEGALAGLIRPSGFYRSKARKLKSFAELLHDCFHGDLDRLLTTPSEDLRPVLLATHGIGPETADSILLYAAGRPRFVVDAYARRLFTRLGHGPQRDTYDAWQAFFESSLPRDAALFNEYHALIVEHGKRHCRTHPLCSDCPLAAVCPSTFPQQRRSIRSACLPA
jgi:endonuclease-3 related protein